LSVKVAGVENVHFSFGNVLTIAFWFAEIEQFLPVTD